MTEENIVETIGSYCPDAFGYECNTHCTNETGLKAECRGCWNREMPNTEPKEEPSCDDVKNAYEQGLNDAWELVNKLHAMTSSELVRAYRFSKPEYVLNKFTYEEALAKLKAYEEAQKIEVGDVLKYKDEECYSIVLKVNESGSLYLLFTDGSAGVHPREGHKKTGKHIDIQSILAQIGE